jgi:hypothetical protein
MDALPVWSDSCQLTRDGTTLVARVRLA